ncbi:MAG: DUF308 domain-containing protein [Bacilli bacterium]|nr:DUF308 domain-containing protein [Bacilli bacterium]
MKKTFQNITNSIICVSALALIIGLIIIFYPSISLKTFGIIGAIYLIIHGLILISLEMRITKIFVPFESMLTGVLSIVLGIVLLSKPDSASILIAVSLGMWIIVSSINSIKVACFFRKIKDFPSTLIIILSILDIVMGYLAILNPFEASITLALYLGVMLVVHSIFNIVDMIILKKNLKDKEKFIKEKISKLIPKFE